MESEFMRMQREATEQLRKMNQQARPLPPEKPPAKETKSAVKKSGLGINLEDDKILLLFLLFLLFSDGGDPILMLALIYLLM